MAAIADHVVDEDGSHRLVVTNTTRIEVAVLFNKGERVTPPVFGLGLDHVDMGEQHDSLQHWIRPWQDRHQIAALGMTGRHDQMKIAFRVATRPQPRRHCACGHRTVTHRLGGVDLDQFLIKGAECRLIRAETLGRDRPRGHGHQKCHKFGQEFHRLSPEQSAVATLPSCVSAGKKSLN